MTQSTKTKTSAPKGRVLTPKELELAEALQKALVGKATAVATLNVCRNEIGRLTREINKLAFQRVGVVWAEARETAGAAPAPTREQLVKGT